MTRRLRPKTFDMVQHDPDGMFPIRVSTVHTRKGQGFWALSLKGAKRLQAALAKAIERAEAPTQSKEERHG